MSEEKYFSEIPQQIGSINKKGEYLTSLYIHEPTGISGYSLSDLHEKVARHYANEINDNLNFYELKSKP